MFAQKKKKSKIWLVIPVILALAAGLWLNAGITDEGEDESSIAAGSDQYEEDISDLAGRPDPSAVPEDEGGESGLTGSGSQTADDGSDDPGSYDGLYEDEIYDGAGDSGYDAGSGGTGFEPESGMQNDGASSSSGDGAEKEYAGRILVISGEDGSISILRYDENGRVTSREKTDIDASMLTETDQQLFRKGFVLNDESELSELLQDFEG